MRPTLRLNLGEEEGGGGSGAGWREPGPEGGENAPEDREEGSAEVALSMASRRAALCALCLPSLMGSPADASDGRSHCQGTVRLQKLRLKISTDGEARRATETENARLEMGGTQVYSLATTQGGDKNVWKPLCWETKQSQRKRKAMEKGILHIKRKTQRIIYRVERRSEPTLGVRKNQIQDSVLPYTRFRTNLLIYLSLRFFICKW